MWPGCSVVECLKCKREILGSSPGRETFFFRPLTIGGSVLGLRAAKRDFFLVPAWFRADSGTNLIKRGKM